MVVKEVILNYHMFNPFWVQHASIHVKKFWHSRQKKYLLRYLIKFIRSRGWSRSRNSDLRLRGARVGGGPKEIISAPQHCFQERQGENWSVPHRQTYCLPYIERRSRPELVNLCW